MNYICKICNNEFTHKSLCYHITHTHNISIEEYYDKYIQKGICSTCGKQTKFISLSKGFRQYCSHACAAKNDSTKQKRIKTNLVKYNCENISQVDSIKQKKLNSYMSHLDEIKEKVKQTNREKYNCDWYTQSEDFKQKYRDICINNYNVDNYSKSTEYKNKCEITTKLNNQYMLDNNFIPIQEINSKYGTGWYQQNKDKVIIYKEKGYIKDIYLNDIIKYSQRVNSKFQQEVFEFINISTAIQNTRKIIAPYELDIYIPKLNLAIECDGIFWHSELDSNYHLMKTELCEEKGITLIHITDWQWNNQKDIIKSIINSYLHRYNNIIYAKDCKIIYVNQDIANEFLTKNNIFGEVIADKHIGLYHNNELIQIMSVNSKNNSYEILRFCSKLNTKVIGGFIKLSNILNKSIYSYIDKSLFNYVNNNWNIIKEIPPSYTLYKQNNRILGSNISEEEKQQLLNNNWLCVYDCGKYLVNLKGSEL